MGFIKHTLIIAGSLVLITRGLASAQAHDTMYGRSIPIYRSAKDSTELALIQQKIDEEYSRHPLRERKIDSLTTLLKTVREHAITGKRKIYTPSDDYLSSDRLGGLEDTKGITRISISEKNELPLLLFDCHDLEELELVNTSIKRLPGKLRRLPRLKTIYIFNNRIRGKLKLGKNNVVTSLSIHNDNPDGLPRSFRKFRALTDLNLAENNIRRFPNGARFNKHLRELNLQRNHITLAGTIRSHPYLQKLGLQWNAIEYVPGSIAQFSKLTKLSFNSNKITDVHPGIRKLKNLEILSFYRNQLREIPAGVYQITSLKEIDLFHNQIEAITPDIAYWKVLHTLYLSHNKIVSLPENLDSLRQLSGLYVWDNRLGKLPETIGRLTKLKFLRANGNYLKTLPASFLQLSNLEEVDLSHNYITSVPIGLFSLRHLKIVSLVDNPFDKDTWAFLPEQVKMLRAKGVFVHTSEESETHSRN